jgi:predicted Rossmann fold flavoprotein
MSRFCDTLIIGAGASGLMCGAHLKNEFLILEGADKPAGKLAVSGGGRCNFTNESISADNYAGDSDFIASALGAFSSADMVRLAQKWGVEFEVRKNRQLFCKHSAKDLITPLLRASKDRIVSGTKVTSVSFENGVFEVESTKGSFGCKNLIVASGGVSYPLLGATDVGYAIAKNFGHAVVTPKPALVGFTVQPPEFWFKELSGVAVNATVTVGTKTFEDSVLFTHKGISGPAILNASLYWEKGTILIDFLPHADIDSLLCGTQKQITTVLGLPKRVATAFLASIGLEDKRVDKLSAVEKKKLKKLKYYEFAPAGTFGLSKAEITKGGVSTEQIEPASMQSKLQKGLYFIGEVLDVNGELGGYNFHFAFASAIKCAASIR